MAVRLMSSQIPLGESVDGHAQILYFLVMGYLRHRLAVPP